MDLYAALPLKIFEKGHKKGMFREVVAEKGDIFKGTQETKIFCDTIFDYQYLLLKFLTFFRLINV